ncbi:MAG: hypothetical protein K0R57_6548 [Paenibacillaceae bacterium]|nr:hypothetical protein [Paenibacillaceae bacterium]
MNFMFAFTNIMFDKINTMYCFMDILILFHAIMKKKLFYSLQHKGSRATNTTSRVAIRVALRAVGFTKG